MVSASNSSPQPRKDSFMGLMPYGTDQMKFSEKDVAEINGFMRDMARELGYLVKIETVNAEYGYGRFALFGCSVKHPELEAVAEVVVSRTDGPIDANFMAMYIGHAAVTSVNLDLMRNPARFEVEDCGTD